VIAVGAGLNVSMARNEGWKAAHADLCVFVDDDNTVGPTMLAELTDACRPSSVGLATPVIYAGAGEALWLGGTRRSPWTGITRCLHHGCTELPAAKTWPTYAAPDVFAIPRDVLEQIGGFSEVLFPMCEEEADLYERLRAAGFECVVVRDATARHFGFATENPGEALVRATTINGPDRPRLYPRARVLYHKLYARGLARATTLLVFDPLWAAWAALRCLRVQAPLRTRLATVRAVFAGLWDGYRVNPRAVLAGTRATDEPGTV
jgi:GT2 family glycosyltransferase